MNQMLRRLFKNNHTASFRKLFYAYAFFDDFILIYPFYAVMFSDRGLSPAQISLLLVVWSVTSFVLEVPSGAIADRFSRKGTLMASGILRIAAYAAWLAAPNFIGFLVGFIAWGLGSALASGTTEALLYDELKSRGIQKQYAKISGTMGSLRIIGTMAAGFLGGVLAGWGYSFLLLASIASLAVVIVVISLIPSAPIVRSTGEANYFYFLKEGVRSALKNRKLAYIVAISSFVVGVGAVDEYFNLLFREKGFSNSAIGFWFGVVFLIGALGSYCAQWLEGKIRSYGLIIIVWGTLLGAATLLPGIFSPIFIALFIGVFHISEVLLDAELQHSLPDHVRATSTSVVGFFEEIVALAVYCTFGVVAGQQYVAGYTVITAVIIMVGLLFSVLLMFKSKSFFRN